MSESIDNRVVQMRFDNEQFERGIQTSIRSLKKLDDSMDFESGTKSFRQLEKSINDVKFDKLLAGLDSIANKFTFIGQLGMRLKNEVIDKLIDSGERMVKSLSMDQVSVGWDKYAQKTSAVQTIMAATAKDFTDTSKQMEVVNAQLENLMWFTDETSYNFVDMVGNIGKFTSAGVKLDDANEAMQGIALWAAKSGANAQQASHAMYQLSQALGAGAVTLLDWKSIENVNMHTIEFKETALETAVALGTLTKSADGVYKTLKGTEVTAINMRETLSDKWFTSDVLTQTLSKYGAAAIELNKLYKELDEEFTTSELINYVKEFNAGTLDMEGTAKVFGMTVEELQSRLSVFNTEAMKFSLSAFEAGQEAKTFAEAIGSVQDAVSSKWMKSFEIIFGNYIQAKELWTNLANILYDIFASSGDTRNEMLRLWAVMEKGGRDTFIDSLWESLAAILQLLKPVQAGFRAVFPPMTAERLAELVQGFHNFVMSLKLSEEQMTKLARIFRGVFSIFDIGGTLIKKIVVSAFKSLQRILNETGLDFLDIGANAGDAINSFRELIKETDIIDVAFNMVADGIIFIIKHIKELPNPIDLATKAFEYLKDNIGQFISFVIDSISNIDLLNASIIGLTIGAGLLFVMFSKILNGAKSGLGIINSISSVISKFGGVLSQYQKNLKAKMLKEIAISIGILAASIMALSTLNIGQIAQSLIAIGVALGGMIATDRKSVV